jgi:hypothetical protein
LEEPFESIGVQLALFVDDLVTQFETFPADALRSLEEALPLASADAPQVIDMTMVFRLSNLESFQRELELARRRFESG